MPRHQIMIPHSAAPPVIGAEARSIVTFEHGSGWAVK